MANPNDNLRRLYQNGLKHFSLPDFDTFQQDMKDEQKRRRFYTNMQGAYSLPDFDTFSTDIGAVTVAAPEAASASDASLRSRTEPARATDGKGVSGVPQSQVQPQRGLIGQTLDAGLKAVTDASVRPHTGQQAASASVRPTVGAPSGAAQPHGWEDSPERQAFQIKVNAAKAGLKRRGDDFQQQIEGIQKGNKSGSSKGELEIDPHTGRMDTAYYTAQGERVGSRMQQSRANSEYHQWWENNTEAGQRSKEQRLQHEFEDGLTTLWLRHNSDESRNAAQQAWTAAEAEYDSAVERNRKNKSMVSGVAMDNTEAAALSQLESVDNFTDRLTTHDLDALMDNAWKNLGADGQKSLVDDCYRMLSQRYQGADELELYKYAKEMARQQSDLRMYRLAVEKNLPKGKLDYFMRKVGDMNLLTNIGKGIAVNRTGKTGDMAAYEAANEEYRQDGHKILDVAGTVVGFAFDPTMLLSGGVGGAAARGALWAGGRYMAGRGASAAVVKGASREFAHTLSGRLAAGVVGGSANFGTFEGIKEMENQFAHGGKVATMDENGNLLREGRYVNEGYSASAVGGQALHGLIMGGAIGWLGPVTGNVSDKLVKGTTSTAGKVAARSGLYAGATVAEGTIFSIPEWYEGNRDGFDVWTDNMAMMVGFKAKHMLKSAGGVLGDLKASFEKPANGQKNRLDFASRLRMRMDAPSDGGLVTRDGRFVESLALTKDEAAELSRYGYRDLRELVESSERTGDASKGALITANAPEIVSRLTDMVRDTRVSEAARAKMYYYATGRKLPMSMMMRGELREDGNGGFTVKSYGANGVITSRSFKSRKRADLELERIRRQTELNSIEVGEWYQPIADFESRIMEASRRVAAKYDWRPIDVYRTYEDFLDSSVRGKDKELSEAQKNIYSKIIAELDGIEEDSDPAGKKRSAINDKYGVDIDRAIRKDLNRRTEAEQSAIEEYISELMPQRKTWNEAGQKLLPSKGEPRDVEDVGYREAGAEEDAAEFGADGFADDASQRSQTELPRMADGEAQSAQRKYAAGDIKIRNSDGTELRGRLTGYMNENGEHEYFVEGDLNRLHYATEQELDNILSEYIPDDPAQSEAGQPTEPQPVDPNRPQPEGVTNVKDYDNGYSNGVETAQNLSDAQLSEEINKLRTDAETLTDFGRGWLEAHEYEQQRRRLAAQPTPDPNVGLDSPRHTQDVGAPVPENAETVPNIGENAEIIFPAVDELKVPTENRELSTESDSEGGVSVANGQQSGDGSDASLRSRTEQPLMEEEALTPLQRIPRNEKGEPMFELAESAEVGWDALVEFSKGDAAKAKKVADIMVETKRKEYEKAQKLKPKGKTPSEILKSEEENEAQLAQAENEYNLWQRMARVEQSRQDAIRSQQEAEARRLAAERAEAEKAEREAREEAERLEREALEGIPEWHMDSPENARKRGARRFSGQMFQRQEPVQGVIGNEVEVKFSQKDLPKGRVAVIEASQLQPSHVQGQRNPMFFIDEAQPKNRAEVISVYAAKDMAEGIRPQEITGSATAYTGAPTINTRGEVIQGNNRSDALRFLWGNNLPTQQQTYKQYLLDNAEQFGIDPEAVNAMQHPVLVNMLDVDDAEAIRLGQMTAQDTESGGIERIKPKNVAQKLGEDMRTFANQLLRTSDEEASFGQLVDRNGTEVLKWMNQVGAISNTQYQSAFDSKGNLTAEAKNDLQKVLYQAVFKGVSPQLEEMFDKLPAKAQRAILSTAFRDMDSPFAGKMLPEIQASIAAYNQLMSDPAFVEAKNIEQVSRAISAFKSAIALDDRFEQYMPADNFSNFALHLAGMYKASDMSQSTIASYFNQMYDFTQGKKAATLFEEADTTEYPLAEVINKVLNIQYQPAKNGNNNVANGGADVALRNRTGQDGEPRGSEPPASREQTEAGAEPSERGGGITGDSRGSGNIGNGGESQETTQQKRLTKEAASGIIAEMEQRATVAPELELTIENWDAQFGENGIVSTPIGEVKMGENQFTKLMRQGRNGKLGMIRPTLEDPDIIIEDASEAKDNQTTERESSFVFVKTFTKPDGSRYYYFTSVTVSKDGHEVVVSNQEKRRNVLTNLLMKGKLVWKHADNVSPASDLADGLYSSQGNLSDPASEGTDAPQTNNVLSDRKVTNSASYKQENSAESSVQPADNKGAQTIQTAVEIASSEVNTEPTPAQAEAGNYKKGHVTIGDFDITIENPAGSVRKGVDANGKAWSTTMANAYGYIKGTESKDGDPLDVFLHEDMDYWNGRKVYVVDQTNTDGTFDEHKVMLGFNDKDEAMSAYLANYDSSWAQTHPGIRISETNVEDFNKWVQSSHRKTKPFADYSTVSKVTEQRTSSTITGKGYDQIASHPTYDIERRTDSEGAEYYAIRLKKGFKDREAWKAIAEKYDGIYSASEGRGVFLFYNGRDSLDAFLREVGADERDTAEENPRFEIDNAKGNRTASAEACEVAKGMLEAAGIDVIEVGEAEAQKMLESHGDVQLMGSRTERKMSKVAEHYAGMKLDRDQQAVVDVFSGKSDNVAIEVERADGRRRVVMRQGNESKAGAKHSLFKHFEVRRNSISADDIAMIPEVISKGERSVNDKKVSYDYVADDGVKLRVTTEVRGDAETFTNFYTNRKASEVESSSVAYNAVGTRHHSGARSLNPEVSDAKIGNNPQSDKSGNNKEVGRSSKGDAINEDVRYLKNGKGVVYGWTEGGKVYLNRDAMNPETPLHEYTHLWDDMVRRENPELWERGKELLKQTQVWQEVLDDPNYADIRNDEDAVASEVHSRLTGRRGAERIEEMMKEAATEPDMVEKAKRFSLIHQMKRWLSDMFRGLKKTLSKWSKRDLRNLTAEDFVNMTLRDLAEGVNPKSGEKDLVAIHNISEENLRKALDLGGFPMPSIAITKAGIGHTGYGGISLVFGKESVNPADRHNKVYSGDAWTPTFPETGYKLNSSKTGEIYDRANKAGRLPLFKAVDFHPDNYERRIDSRKDVSLVDAFKEDYGAKQLFLSEKDNAVKEYEKREVEKYSTDDINLYEKVLEVIGEERLRGEDSDYLYSELKRLIGEHSGKDMDSMKPFVAKTLASNTRLKTLDYADNGNFKTETDLEATRAKIDERIVPREFQAWLEQMFSGVVEKTGIRNERDMFTPSGESRRWEVLYDAVTLENVVKAMRRQADKGGNGFFGGSIFGAAHRELKDMEDIRREAADRIRSVYDEEIEATKKRLEERLDEITPPSAGGSFSAAMDFVENVREAVVKSHTPEGIYRYLSDLYPDMTMGVAKEISDIVGEIQKMSTRYLEAKPHRAVKLEEVRLAVVPEGTPDEIVRSLESRGIAVRTYERGNEHQRNAIVSRETSERELRFHAAMSRGRGDFDAIRERAVSERGIVMPGLNEAEVRVVEVPRHDFAGDRPIAQARKWARENIVGEHSLIDSDGRQIIYSISGKSIEKYLSSSAVDKSDSLGLHLSALTKLPQIIGNSIEAEVHPSYNKGYAGMRGVENGYNDSALIHRFYGAINVDDHLYRVKTTIVEHKDAEANVRTHSYEVTKIEVLPDISENTSIIGAQASTSSREGTLQTAKLLKGVEKSYDPGKKLLDESEIAKYAEMDKDVEAARGIELTEEDSEPTASEPVSDYSAENANFASRYETEDGKTIRYSSERGEGYGGLFDFDFSGDEAISRNDGGGEGESLHGNDSRTRSDGLQRGGGSLLDNGNGLRGRLDSEQGEFSVVERVFTESGSFKFTSGERIESADDVAFIFSALEDAAKEHSFAVYVKDGVPTVVELGMGTFTGTMVDMPTASLAYNRIGPDEIYFVHNHPSGNLVCSAQDVQMLRKFEEMSDVPVYGVIINLKTGKYGTFDTSNNTSVGEKRIPERELPLSVHTLDKQIFARDYDPMAQPLVRGSQDVAKFLNSHRMGDRGKVSFLILSRANRIVGNIHTPFTKILGNTDDVARYISERIVQFGGESAILYGDFEMSDGNGSVYRKLKQRIESTGGHTPMGGPTLLDVVHVEGNHTRSANDEGLLREPGSEYHFRDVETDREEASLRSRTERRRERRMMEVEMADKIEDLFDSAVAGDLKGKPVEVGRLTNAGKEYLERLSGLTMKEKVSFVLNPSDLVHIYRRHFGNNEKDSRNIPLTKEDIRNISKIISEPSRILFGKEKSGNQRSMFFFLKEAENGSYNLMEVYADKKGNLTAKSFFKSKEGVSQRAMLLNESSTLTSVTDGATLSDGAKLPQFFENPTIVEEESLQQRFRDVEAMGESASLRSHTERPRGRGIAEVEMAQTSPEAKSNHAVSMSKKFNTPIRIVNDPKELKSTNAEQQARMRRSKGFYDPATGEVVMVVANNATVEDVVETVLHEVVAHKGLREMIGDENYDAFCDEVYDHLKDDLKQQVDEETTRRFMNEPGKGYEHHRRVAVDELFGRLSEKGFEDFTKAERGVWRKLRDKVLEAINKFLGSLRLPKWVRLGDNELRYMLWRSHERLRTKGDYVDMARDAAKREELGLNRNDAVRVRKSVETTADKIEKSFDAAISGDLKGKPVEIGKLTSEGREYLEKLSGVKMKEDVSFVLNPSDLVHMYRNHFGNNEKDKGNNIPLTKEDIRAISEVVSHPERVIFGIEPDGLKRNLFYFLAPAKEGAYNLLEIYGDRKGNLTAKTFYKTRKGVSQRVLSLMKSEHLTSVTDGATLSDGAKLPQFFENPTIVEEESFEYRFRDGETGDIWKDHSVGLQERITNAAIRLSNNQSGDLTLRNDAMRAIGGNLTSLRKAMAAQRRFDQATVKRVADLARILMQNGYLSGMTSGEMQRLISAVKNSVGHKEVKESVQKIMDIMVGNQLRNGEAALRQLLAIRGSKVDARGVEVQGALDVEGQRTMEVVKKAMTLTEDDITDRIAEALNRMSDPDNTISDQAALEYAALHMALDYVQNIANSKAEEKTLRDELKLAKEDKDAGRMTDDAYKQFVETTEDAIRKNKIERAEAYFNLVGRLSDSLRGSIENAKAFREAEKARIKEIHHNANSDMEGRPCNEHHKDDWKDKFVNNGFVQFLFAPLGTFDQILRVFGNKSANGETLSADCR